MAPATEPVIGTAISQLPGQAVWAAIDRMATAAGRVEAALQPSFIRRLMGGVNREHCRAIVAASLEESGAVRRVLVDASRLAREQSEELSKGDVAVSREVPRRSTSNAEAMLGTCERMRSIVDRWRSAAADHQEGIIGSTESLLSVTRRIQALAREINSPASGLGGKDMA